MAFDVTSNLIGIGIALLFSGVLIGAAVISLSGRFLAAVEKYPLRALDHLRADRDVWKIIDEDAEAAEEMEGWEGPYRLELPDGTTRTFFGRLEGMDGSMKRFLKRLPKR